MIFPGNTFLRLGVPALAAFLPQSVFYSIQNDALSPVCFGAASIFIVRFWRAEIPRAGLGAAAGLALAATFLTKISNAPLLAVSGIFLVWKIFRLAKGKNLRAAAPAVTALAAGAALPAAFWLAWCKHCFGDFTGTAAKIQSLGWTLKPFAEWFSHPLFTPRGGWIFLSRNLETLWRGEIVWHRQPLALPAADLVYVAVSIIFIVIALAGLLPKVRGADAAQRWALGFAFAGFAATLAFLGFLSIIYDFHNCLYPSREAPFFVSGRLLLGALIPFLLLFVFGLDRALNRLGTPAKFLALGALILFMLASEITADWPVFSSPYNWFHL